ncbi:MAG: transglycosylase domain-containing protein [Blastochloris sp.]|mgnify:CR=1 FL=1|nr:transglycosylase domain-containing protein [Blastochloris sp.]
MSFLRRKRLAFNWQPLMWFRRHPIISFILVLPFVAVLALSIYYSLWALAFDMDEVSRMPATTIIYDRHGYVIQRLFEENRLLVGGTKIPQVLKDAVVAKEDERFYYHPGIDPFSILRAVFVNFQAQRVSSGASTITQQLARNSAGIFDRSLDRKLKEMFLALRIELAFSKNEILTFYFNRIYFGGNVYGIGAAAEAYFGKETQNLSLSESAMLVGIIAGPNILSPWRNVENAKRVRAKTLQRMMDCGFITQDQADAAKAEPIILRPLLDKPGSYVASTVQDMLPEFLTHIHIYRGGLRIHTSIDLAFQRAAEQALANGLEAIEKTSGYRNPTRAAYLQKGEDAPVNYLQGAFVAMSNIDGGVLAIVGGRNFEESPFNRATLSKRQIGSTVKPFLYAHAFNVLNCTAFTEVDHSKFDLKNFDPSMIPTGPKPEFITLRQALERSDNYAAVRTGMVAGVEGFAHLLENASGAPIQPLPSSLLGACELTPYELVTAFTIFPNYGVEIKPHLIRRITTHDGKELFQHIDTRVRILSPQVAFQICQLLQGVIDQGTGKSLRTQFKLEGDMGGKTGTTNDYKDSWFVGFSKDVTAGVWVGLDKPATIMPGGYSSRIAVPIWGNIMKLANTVYKPAPFLPPPGVTLAQGKREEKVFFFFKKTIVEGSYEYIRDDQRGNALARIDGPSLAKLQRTESSPSFLRSIVRAVIPSQKNDLFQSAADESSQAVIQDNSESKAPRAVPVTP